MNIELLLIVGHITGTIIGVGGATMIEAHLAQSLKDKLVSKDEKDILAIDYHMVRIGLVLSIVTGFGFLILDKFTDNTAELYDPQLWAKLSIVLLIAGNTLLLQAHKINLYWGSALSFVSWWFAAFVGIMLTEKVHFNFFGNVTFIGEFTSIIIAYVMAVIIGAMILQKFRNKISSTI